MDDEQAGPPLGVDPDGDVSLDAIPLHSTNLLTLLDERGVVQYESPSIRRLYGYDQDELVGEPVADYFHPDDREEVLGAFRSVVASESYTVESVEYRHRRADGSYVWVESVASANPTPDGHYVVNTRDISDQKARQRELEQTNERLDAFASVVGHDLRNPLNVAEGALDLAREECRSEQLDTVARAHERMRTLIDDLLALAREGRPVDEMDAVALADVAEACWRTVETSEATLVTWTDRPILADRSRLRQLLANLVRNSIEHGGTDVTVRIGDLGDGDGFYVADDGPGIPPDEREAVFESGYSTSERGTGFGLAIVAEIARAHGWEISATGNDENGARFEITGVSVVDG